jgi:hypothetical protein
MIKGGDEGDHAASDEGERETKGLHPQDDPIVSSTSMGIKALIIKALVIHGDQGGFPNMRPSSPSIILAIKATMALFWECRRPSKRHHGRLHPSSL